MRFPENVAALLDQIGISVGGDPDLEDILEELREQLGGEPEPADGEAGKGESPTDDPGGLPTAEVGTEPADGDDPDSEVPSDTDGDAPTGTSAGEGEPEGEADEIEAETEPTGDEVDELADEDVGTFDLDDLEGDVGTDGDDADKAEDEATSGSIPTDETDPTGMGREAVDSIADRNERIESFSRDIDHTDVRARVRESGVADRLQRRLEELFSGDRRSQAHSVCDERDDTGLVGGHYDMRQVVRRFAGDTRVRELFHSPSPALNDDVAVCVVLDLSGSMRGNAEVRAKEATGAFLFSIQLFGGEVMAVSFPGSDAYSNLITAPGEQFRWRHLDAVWASGGTPTSLGTTAGREQLESVTADAKLMLVLTDGGATNPSGTRDLVDELRERRDWAVFGFGFGAISGEKLGQQFGEDGYRSVGLDELADALYDIYEAEVRACS